jgi:hypothetical protein
MNYNIMSSLEQSSTELWSDVMSFLPQLIMAILVVIVGWIIASMVGSVVKKLFQKLNLNEALDKAGVDNLTNRAGLAFKPDVFVGSLVKWFIIIVFLVVAFDILQLQAVTAFMRGEVLGYLPHVFAAVLILFVSMIVAGLAGTSLTATLRASNIGQAELFGKITRLIIIVFGIMASLNQLKIAEELVQTLFAGIVFALSLGTGLAFGLGGKEFASQLIAKMTRRGNQRIS